ncbi:preprotein translocase subunit SecY [Patescibacteria group bacterium]|nr:preprotein translocase subunit SecY [Patescibacteria group bacterium]
MSTLKKIFATPDLRNKIIFTVVLLALTRVLAHIPIPGATLENLQEYFNQNQLFGLLNVFSGGTIENFSIILMGVGPYINASIIMQLLTMIIPSLEALSKEGQQGRQKISTYTRYLTVPLAFLQSYGTIALLTQSGQITGLTGINLWIALITATAGCVLMMWLGELITENGIGNGISLLITIGIIAGIPAQIGNNLALAQVDSEKLIGFIILIVLIVLEVALVVFVNEAQRNIPVTYARQVRGNKQYGGSDTYLPLRVIMAGVIPIIFAISIMVFPNVIANFFGHAQTEWIASAALKIQEIFTKDLFYGIFYFAMVIIFTFFYTSVIFQPDQVAENMQKQGGFIPGVRPGSQTIKFLSDTVLRITVIGSMFLAFIAVAPLLLQYLLGTSNLLVTGTGLLILVSVTIETIKQVKSNILMRSYEEDY